MGFFRDFLADTANVIIKNAKPSDETFEFNLYYNCKYLSERINTSRFGITSEIIKNFGLNSSDKIYLAYDDSFWQDGTEGYIITLDGIYGKVPFSDEVVFTSFKKLSDCNSVMLREKGRIYADNYLLGSVCSLGDSQREKIVEFFDTLRIIAANEQNRSTWGAIH